MGRSRVVLSFISAFGSKSDSNNSSSRDTETSSSSNSNASNGRSRTVKPDTTQPAESTTNGRTSVKSWTAPDRPTLSRPASMAFTYQPPRTEIAPDTLPELLPIFTFMNSHANKMYQEGYFLKLNDLDTQGRPSPDRKWVECFAVLTGTVLSIWDAAALDAAAGNQDVPPTFINLTDASIKMLETLPTYDKNAKPLQNILSVSTAGRNRYLFHFNSFHSLTQWTASIRLALFENTSLLEAYTGSIIAGKGRQLNNIRMIMERSRHKYEDWARVRFGVGTPWRRCWFVVTPPSDKDIQRLSKSGKKRSAYDRTTPILTGDIKFYDTKRTKKARPIATITNAYAAFAIYPQSNALIDQSTLIKIEGSINFHSPAQSSTEGFIFVMPELHPAVSGLEILLRFLFPVFDTFGLYGRPTRLIADTNNAKSLMFAFPKQEPYGYLDVLDVVNLINQSGSQGWSEKQWRIQLREATAQRMATANSPASSIGGGKPHQRGSLMGRHGKTRFQEPSTPLSPGFNHSAEAVIETPKATTESPATDTVPCLGHHRTVSDTNAFTTANSQGVSPSPLRLSTQDMPPEPPAHGMEPSNFRDRPPTSHSIGSGSDSDNQLREGFQTENVAQEAFKNTPPAPVAAPPAFSHQPGEVPLVRPHTSYELRRANSRMSSSTLAQLVDVGKLRGEATSGFENIQENSYPNQPYQRDVPTHQRAPFGYATPEQPPSVPAHAAKINDDYSHPSLSQNSAERPSDLHIDTMPPIRRKPLPSHPNHSSDGEYAQEPTSASTDPSFRDLQHTVDEAALSRILPMQTAYTRERTQAQHPQLSRVETESVYDDDGSATPDYASRKSTETKRSEASIPHARMGILKTVGGDDTEAKEVTIGDARYLAKHEEPKENPDIPSIDFGPTMAHNLHTRRPSMSDVLNNFGGSASQSPNRRDGQGEGHARKPSRSPGEDEKRRSVVWQPGMANYRPESPGNRTITPEQFVHHRSASNSHPLDYPLASPGARPRSGDWTQGASQALYGRDLPPRPHSRGSTMLLNQNEFPNRPHSRNSTMLLNQGDFPNRPHSRNSTMLLNQGEFPSRPHSWGSNAVFNQSDLSSHLSAREQEHVARMTGQSFFNLSNNNVKPVVTPGGLVGAIDARERERRYMKEGLSNQMVQQAIAQRQHQMYEAQQMQHIQQSHVGSIYNMPQASYTWDALNQSAYNQPRTTIARPATSSDWQVWSGHGGADGLPPPTPQHSNQYFSSQQPQQQRQQQYQPYQQYQNY